MLKRFQIIDRTRLFGPDWQVVQKWTTVNVSWVTGYMKAKFRIHVEEAGPIVVVLTQVCSTSVIPNLRYLLTALSSIPGTFGAWRENTFPSCILYFAMPETRKRLFERVTILVAAAAQSTQKFIWSPGIMK
jgi:hypothetical protein